ncbi:MAG: hypothetical protein KDD63_21160, partial [Bacteroidetes bacterium]|nr:hypothetical protein [Bacteroidota bacterium]
MKYLITFVGLIVFNLNCLNAQIFVKSDATGINDGTSWTNAYTNLSVAIQTAQAGDQIWVAAGTYLPGDTLSATFSINKNLEIYGGFAGTETILSQRDDSTNLTILSGDINGDDIPEDLIKNKGDNARTIITFQATITNATILDGFTIMRGHADTSAAPFTYAGGGIVSLGHPIIRSCTFTENFARNYGGAIYFGNAGASGAKVEFCKFFLNGSEFGGGGISFNDVNGFNTESLVKDCQFERNYAGSSGGGIRISNSEVEIYSCSFNNNSANFLGGGVMIYQTINNESVSVENCTFKSNESTLGAGLYAEPEAANFLLNVRDCQFIGNIVSPIRAGYDPNGGGMMIFYDGPSNSGTTNVSNCLFKENVAEKIGGGLKVSFLGPNSSVNVDSCIFLENIITPTVLAGGAGIQAGVFNTNSSLQITNSDFLANTGGSAGSLLFETLNGGELDA